MTELVIGYANQHPRKNQRRAVGDTFIVVDGETCKVINISLGSFLCAGYKGAAKVGDDIVIEELLLSDDSRVRVNCPGRVIRLDGSNMEMAAVFLELKGRTFDILEKMMMMRPAAGKGGRPK